MKKLLLIPVVWLAAFLATVCLGDVGLAWDPNAPEDEVEAYYVWLSKNGSTNLVLVARTTNTSANVTNVFSGQHCFTVTASNAFGMTGHSSPACVSIPPRLPTGLRITNITWFVFTNNNSTIVQWSHDLESWRTDAPENLLILAVAVDPSKDSAQFWKVR